MEELLPQVRRAFSSAFGTEPEIISINTSPADIPEWDSMGHVTLASNLEQIFGITLDVDDLMEMENVREICKVLHSKLPNLAQVQGANS